MSAWAEQDEVIGYAAPRTQTVVNLASARADLAEGRSAVFAGRAATFEARVTPLEQSRNQYRADYLRLSRERRDLLLVTWSAVALAALVALLAAVACAWALGWRGPVLVAGVVIVGVVTVLTQYRGR